MLSLSARVHDGMLRWVSPDAAVETELANRILARSGRVDSREQSARGRTSLCVQEESRWAAGSTLRAARTDQGLLDTFICTFRQILLPSPKNRCDS